MHVPKSNTTGLPLLSARADLGAVGVENKIVVYGGSHLDPSVIP